jgi:hypothetical protein
MTKLSSGFIRSNSQIFEVNFPMEFEFDEYVGLDRLVGTKRASVLRLIQDETNVGVADPCQNSKRGR